MHRFSRWFATAAAVVALTTTAAAQGRGTGKASGRVPNAGAHAPRGGGQEHGPREQSPPRKSHDGPKASKPRGKSDGSNTGAHPADAGAAAAPAPAFEPNAISTRISKNPNQLARVMGLVPAGMSIEEASAGFRNQGQFIAALNASKNHAIDFGQLKQRMTVDGLSLGEAARQLRPAREPEGGDTKEVGEKSSTAGSRQPAAQ